MISILLAIYNGEKYLQYTLDSILQQTHSQWELLVGFNGTTDNSKNIISYYNDSRIKIFDYKNDKGKAKTLNKLIQHSQYDWCAMQDDDDIWLPEKLSKQLKYVDNYDVIGTYIRYINDKNSIIGNPMLATNHEEIKKKSLSGNNQIANSSAIFKKEIVIKQQLWNDTLDGIEDFDLWLRLLKNNYKFYNVPEFLTLHRLHKSSNFNTKNFNRKDIFHAY